MRLWPCSRRVRNLRFVIWFVFSNLIHSGRLVLRTTNTHPRIALEFAMQRSCLGHDRDRNLVCLGALATLSSLEALRLCGCLEAWKLGDAQLGAVGEFSIALALFGTWRLLLIVGVFKHLRYIPETSRVLGWYSGGSKVKSWPMWSHWDRWCALWPWTSRVAMRFKMWRRCSGVVMTHRQIPWLICCWDFHSWFVCQAVFPDLPSQNRIYSIRRWIENRSN